MIVLKMNERKTRKTERKNDNLKIVMVHIFFCFIFFFSLFLLFFSLIFLNIPNNMWYIYNTIYTNSYFTNQYWLTGTKKPLSLTKREHCLCVCVLFLLFYTNIYKPYIHMLKSWIHVWCSCVYRLYISFYSLFRFPILFFRFLLFSEYVQVNLSYFMTGN